MKPCRWQWELAAEKGKADFTGPSNGYLLARKDICLFQYIPELIQNHMASLKIEGRMRTADCPSFPEPAVIAGHRPRWPA